MIKKTSIFTLTVIGFGSACKDDRFPSIIPPKQVHPGLKAPFVNFTTGVTGDWQTEVLDRISPKKLENTKIQQQIVALFNAALYREDIEVRQTIYDQVAQSLLQSEEDHYKIGEALARLAASKRINEPPESLLQLIKIYSIEPLSLRQVNSKKVLHNLKNRQNLGDHILPLTQNCFDDKATFNIVFFQGIQSHPLRVWSNRGASARNNSPYLWPVSLLSEDVQNAAIFAVQYDARQLQRDCHLNNYPDWNLNDITASIQNQLSQAGILDKDCIFVGYSMGGLIARQIATDQRNVKGVLFIASPLRGDSRLDLKVYNDLGPILHGLAPFIDQYSAIPEHVEHFIREGFTPSRAGQSIFDLDSSRIEELNNKFLEREIPFRCLAENRKTNLGLVGRDYFTVEPQHAALDSDRTILLDVDHVQISRTNNRDSDLYKQMMHLLAECKPES